MSLRVQQAAAISPKTGPKIPVEIPGQTEPEGFGMGAGGIRWPCLGTESTGATFAVPVTPLLHVAPIYPVNDAIWPQNSPKWPQTGLKMAPI